MSWSVTGKAHYTQFAQVEATDKSELLYTRICTSMLTLSSPHTEYKDAAQLTRAPLQRPMPKKSPADLFPVYKAVQLGSKGPSLVSSRIRILTLSGPALFLYFVVSHL